MVRFPEDPNTAYHHVIREKLRRAVVAIFDEEFTARRWFKMFEKGAPGIYERGFLEKGEEYETVFTPGHIQTHGYDDGHTHNPQEA